LGRDIDAKLALAACTRYGFIESERNRHFEFDPSFQIQGVQYASLEYVSRLKEKGIRISMSRRGNPYDNAYAESFFKSFKYEEVFSRNTRLLMLLIEHQKFLEIGYQ